ncbi:hypothetical protein [Solimonas terrae]|uniref:TetR/AcrR family transcriptional regulator n=1 Tax=Solimonas terrae TaxID=1396819 RepID=A0A6M2BLS8_9GAMM|nr:hypothetical protein [Solimonas terrae]NGY03662.1 hypothetical protein [Solimonas terrae]
MADLIQASELAADRFERHVADKASLFRALVEESLAPLQEHIDASRPQAASFEVLLRSTCIRALQEIRSEPELFGMMLRNESALRAIFEDDIVGLMLRPLHDDLREAVRNGALPPIDADMLMTIMIRAADVPCRLMAEQPSHDAQPMAAEIGRQFTHAIDALQAATQTPMIRIGSRKLRGAAR